MMNYGKSIGYSLGFSLQIILYASVNGPFFQYCLVAFICNLILGIFYLIFFINAVKCQSPAYRESLIRGQFGDFRQWLWGLEEYQQVTYENGRQKRQYSYLETARMALCFSIFWIFVSLFSPIFMLRMIYIFFEACANRKTSPQGQPSRQQMPVQTISDNSLPMN